MMLCLHKKIFLKLGTAGFIFVGIPFFPLPAMGHEWDYQLDAYYTAVGYTLHLTTAPVPFYEGKKEREIYKHLLRSPSPRFLIIEASANPLPLTGVYLKRHARSFYNSADVGKDQNIIQSITTGFEEPAALSLFLGNVIDFRTEKKGKYGEGKGYIGYLLSAGTKHIKDNELIDDDWLEAEWKIKGDRIKTDVKLLWSFRGGGKFHANKDIADVFYIAFRRSRVDYLSRQFSWLTNMGFLYKFDFSSRNFDPIQHQLVVDRKFPLNNTKVVPTLAFGFVYRTKDKYRRALRTDTKEFQVLIQPNIEF